MNKEFLKQANKKLSILDVAKYYGLQVKQHSEDSYSAICCFHSEDTPSLFFTLLPEEADLFHCFGCAEGGDAFSFIRLKEGSFKKALETLEDLCGGSIKSLDSLLEELNSPEASKLKEYKIGINYAVSSSYREFLKKLKGHTLYEEQCTEVDSKYKELDSLLDRGTSVPALRSIRKSFQEDLKKRRDKCL